MKTIDSLEEFYIQLELCGGDLLGCFYNTFLCQCERPTVYSKETGDVIGIPLAVNINTVGKIVINKLFKVASQKEMKTYEFEHYYINNLKLKTLKYCPASVWSFNANNNYLVDLCNLPEVKHGIYVDNNDLVSLKGLPKKLVNGDLMLSDNYLTTLSGCPRIVKGHFSCSWNHLKTLEGGPSVVGGKYDVSQNPLLSTLAGAPRKFTTKKDLKPDSDSFFDCSETSFFDCNETSITGKQLKDYFNFLSCPSDSLIDEIGCYKPKEEN